MSSSLSLTTATNTIASGNSSQDICAICLELNDATSLPPNPSKSQLLLHKACLTSYVTSIIQNASHGTCPPIYCPLNQQQPIGGVKSIISYEKWTSILNDSSITSKYHSMAKDVLSILCCGCHCIRTIGDDGKTSLDSRVLLNQKVSQESLEDIKRLFVLYSVNTVNTEQTYKTLAVLAPRSSHEDEKYSWSVFRALCSLITNPERRSSLILRYIIEFPKVWTPCCDREHCFKCKTKEFHFGKTCEENIASIDSTILFCPACSLALVRGDGCNSFTCPCGRQFSWSQEKELNEKSLLFSRYALLFTEFNPSLTTADLCGQILCSLAEGDITQARAWRARNLQTTDEALYKIWKMSNPIEPSQQCLLQSSLSLNEGLRLSLELWKTRNSKDYSRRATEHNLAKKWIFPNTQSRNSSLREYYLAAQRIVREDPNKIDQSSPKDLCLRESALLFLKGIDPELLTSILARIELSSCLQFLLIYGKQKAESIRMLNFSFAKSCEFDRLISNSQLTYSSDRTTVLRDGSISCYPAAFCELLGPQATLTVTLISAPRSPNWFTAGLAKRSFPSQSSDGVGRSKDSWGIADDRGITSQPYANTCACGRILNQCQKLKQDDVVTLTVDTLEGWFEVSINDTEYLHRFEIPILPFKEYVFAMTFANDTSVQIMSELRAGDTSRDALGGPGHLNKDQSEMYMAFRRVVRKLTDLNLSTIAPNNVNGVSSNELLVVRDKWAKQFEALYNSEDKPSSDCEDLFKSSTIDTSDKGQYPSKSTLPSTSMPVPVPVPMPMPMVARPSSSAEAVFCKLFPVVTKLLTKANGTVPDNKETMATLASTAAIGSLTSEDNDTARITCETLFQCVCFLSSNRDRLEKASLVENATAWLLEHGSNAAFTAAATLSPQHQGAADYDASTRAKAFTIVYPSEMQEFYDYNDSMREPLLTNIAKTCRCIPRHFYKCTAVLVDSNTTNNNINNTSINSNSNSNSNSQDPSRGYMDYGESSQWPDNSSTTASRGSNNTLPAVYY